MTALARLGFIRRKRAPGLNSVSGIAVSGENLFVANGFDGTIAKYTTSGATVNAALVSGLNNASAIAVSGGNLFVTDVATGTIGKYTTSGATVNAALITGLTYPQGIAESGGYLYVTNRWIGTIGKYATAGATVNAALVTGLNDPVGIAVSGKNLFVTTYFGGTIGKYTTSGATVNAALVAGLNGPIGIAVVSHPQPGDYNDNGTVDAADYIVWRKNDGSPAGYNTWRGHFGQSSGSGAALPSATPLSPAVPEPSTLILAALALVSFAWRVGSVRFAEDYVCARGLPPYNYAKMALEPTRSRPR